MFCIPWIPNWSSPKPSPEALKVGDEIASRIQQYFDDLKPNIVDDRYFTWRADLSDRNIVILDHWYTDFVRNTFGAKEHWRCQHWSVVDEVSEPDGYTEARPFQEAVEKRVYDLCVKWAQDPAREGPKVHVSRVSRCFNRRGDRIHFSILAPSSKPSIDATMESPVK